MQQNKVIIASINITKSIVLYCIQNIFLQNISIITKIQNAREREREREKMNEFYLASSAIFEYKIRNTKYKEQKTKP